MPGLVNAHGHVGNDGRHAHGSRRGYTRENVLRQLRTYAQYGITTVFSLGDEQAAGVRAARRTIARRIDRARVFVAGPVIGGDTAEAARAMTDKVAAMKPDC